LGDAATLYKQCNLPYTEQSVVNVRQLDQPTTRPQPVELSVGRVGFGRVVGGRVVGGQVDGLPSVVCTMLMAFKSGHSSYSHCTWAMTKKIEILAECLSLGL
jgi:hypothetical protein